MGISEQKIDEERMVKRIMVFCFFIVLWNVDELIITTTEEGKDAKEQLA